VSRDPDCYLERRAGAETRTDGFREVTGTTPKLIARAEYLNRTIKLIYGSQ